MAQFVGIHDGEALDEDERLVRFHLGHRRVMIVPDDFFFQEGHGELYEDAQYGVFKFDERDRYLLVGPRQRRTGDDRTVRATLVAPAGRAVARTV